MSSPREAVEQLTEQIVVTERENELMREELQRLRARVREVSPSKSASPRYANGEEVELPSPENKLQLKVETELVRERRRNNTSESPIKLHFVEDVIINCRTTAAVLTITTVWCAREDKTITIHDSSDGCLFAVVRGLDDVVTKMLFIPGTVVTASVITFTASGAAILLNAAKATVTMQPKQIYSSEVSAVHTSDFRAIFTATVNGQVGCHTCSSSNIVRNWIIEVDSNQTVLQDGIVLSHDVLYYATTLGIVYGVNGYSGTPVLQLSSTNSPTRQLMLITAISNTIWTCNSDCIYTYSEVRSELIPESTITWDKVTYGNLEHVVLGSNNHVWIICSTGHILYCCTQTFRLWDSGLQRTAFLRKYSSITKIPDTKGEGYQIWCCGEGPDSSSQRLVRIATSVSSSSATSPKKRERVTRTPTKQIRKRVTTAKKSAAARNIDILYPVIHSPIDGTAKVISQSHKLEEATETIRVIQNRIRSVEMDYGTLRSSLIDLKRRTNRNEAAKVVYKDDELIKWIRHLTDKKLGWTSPAPPSGRPESDISPPSDGTPCGLSAFSEDLEELRELERAVSELRIQTDSSRTGSGLSHPPSRYQRSALTKWIWSSIIGNTNETPSPLYVIRSTVEPATRSTETLVSQIDAANAKLVAAQTRIAGLESELASQKRSGVKVAADRSSAAAEKSLFEADKLRVELQCQSLKEQISNLREKNSYLSDSATRADATSGQLSQLISERDSLSLMLLSSQMLRSKQVVFLSSLSRNMILARSYRRWMLWANNHNSRVIATLF